MVAIWVWGGEHLVRGCDDSIVLLSSSHNYPPVSSTNTAAPRQCQLELTDVFIITWQVEVRDTKEDDGGLDCPPHE